MKRISIDPITRLEGHGKIDISLLGSIARFCDIKGPVVMRGDAVANVTAHYISRYRAVVGVSQNLLYQRVLQGMAARSKLDFASHDVLSNS